MFLSGLKVLDLADEKASFCSKLLADMGARVIKVEKPGGDDSRKAGPFIGNMAHPEKSLSFFYNNTGKFGITLDLEHSAGKKIFYELVKCNDVIVESFPPAHSKKLELNFEKLLKINPKLIMASVSGFGQTGSMKDFKTCNLVASAYGGQMFVTGATIPLKLFGDQSYLTASIYSAIGILLAVRKQRKSGRGEHIDISIQEAMTSCLEHVLVQFFYENKIASRLGAIHWNQLFHILPCKDGFIQITLFDKWDILVEWMEKDGMAQDLVDSRYQDESFRRKNVDHIVNVLKEWTVTHTKHELFEKGQLLQFPWAPIHSPKEIINSPQLIDRNFFQDILPTKKDAIKKCLGIPVTLDPPRSCLNMRAPSIAEHNLIIYHNELGISLNEVKKLSALGVI